jgi:hypothetical protein|tara:strand:+ start:1951 stop:2160 length:210 start_codon:yes stop_codon:yes gene_type:complete
MEGGTIIAIILASSSALTGVITAIFHSASLSRCKNVDCCWSCFVCDREVLSEETYRAEQVEAREIEARE